MIKIECKLDFPCEEAGAKCVRCGHNLAEENRRKELIKSGMMVSENGLLKLIIKRKTS